MAEAMMWFGTPSRMKWIPVPLRGATATPAAWGSDGVYLNGGGYVDRSWGSHKEYTYEWRPSSSRQVAQTMKSYYDGSFGRGLLYWHDPLLYDMNLLPAHWADPSMGVGSGARSLVSGVVPTGTATASASTQDLPVVSATYVLDNTLDGYRSDYESLFIPIPPGYTLAFGSQYSYTGAGRILYCTQGSDGTLGSPTALTALTNASSVMTNTTSTAFGIRLWVGKNAPGAGSVTIAAMTARLYVTGGTNPTAGPWIGGMGHSGSKFAGPPTYVVNGPNGGGQIGFAATFKEVGSWL